MELVCGWWNVENFAHFDPARRAERRWPSLEAAFTDKLGAVAQVLGDQILIRNTPVILGLAEITAPATEALRDRILPTYRVESLDLHSRSDLNVAFIYPADPRFIPVEPFTVRHVARGTRPMAVVDFVHNNHRVRFIACHWTARFEDDSQITRSEIARQLGRYIFDYFAESDTESRHVIVMGDLNEEPFGTIERELHANRSRERAKKREHWRDVDVSRKYLYNLAWRFTGERRPFGPAQPLASDSAGTYYYNGQWHTFDHFIVDGSLLSEPRPYIDERSAEVVAHPLLFADSAPKAFSWVAPGQFSGVSDHLPITAELHL